MSDQITPAPRAHPTHAPPTQPTPPAATAAPQANSRPTTANAATAPTAGAASAQLPSATPPAEEPTNLNDKLNSVDRYWKFKGAIQAVAIIIGFIGIGTIGWCVSTTPFNDDLTYGYDEYWTLWPSLVTFSVSVLWCAACILFFVVKKRGIHPGLRVALELLLWLSFIVTALFAMVSLFEIRQWGEYGDLSGSSYYGYSSSNGGYELQPNNTWVWEFPSSSSNSYGDDGTTSSISTSYTRPCDHNSSSSSSSYYSSSYFSSCAEQDAYINKLWQEKPHRESVELTGVVCQWFLMVLHFVLFVWACVDCHRYNRSKTSKDAEKIAANIVQSMITNGAIVPPPGQAHLRPMAPWGNQQMGYYQLPQQGQAYPMTTMYPQGQQQQQQYQYQPQMSGAAAPGTTGPSNEKGEQPRYV